jgi:hypothetical protein
MVKEFTYTSHNETKNRKVFVIKENDHYIAGIDLNLLSKEDSDFIISNYKDVAPTNDFKSKIELENFNPVWNKAYRQFSKNKIY